MAIASDGNCRVWGTDPPRLDPDDVPPGRPFARVMTWAPCVPCSLEAHVPLAQFLLAGIDCPRCGATLQVPPPDAQDQLQRLLRLEDRLLEQLA